MLPCALPVSHKLRHTRKHRKWLFFQQPTYLTEIYYPCHGVSAMNCWALLKVLIHPIIHSRNPSTGGNFCILYLKDSLPPKQKMHYYPWNIHKKLLLRTQAKLRQGIKQQVQNRMGEILANLYPEQPATEIRQDTPRSLSAPTPKGQT